MCLAAGQVPSTNFRLYSGKDGKAGEAMTMWLDQTHSDFPLDQIPDVTIETGIFKVSIHSRML